MESAWYRLEPQLISETPLALRYKDSQVRLYVADQPRSASRAPDVPKEIILFICRPDVGVQLASR